MLSVCRYRVYSPELLFVSIRVSAAAVRPTARLQNLDSINSLITMGQNAKEPGHPETIFTTRFILAETMDEQCTPFLIVILCQFFGVAFALVGDDEELRRCWYRTLSCRLCCCGTFAVTAYPALSDSGLTVWVVTPWLICTRQRMAEKDEQLHRSQ
jgi:hypothetical protein